MKKTFSLVILLTLAITSFTQEVGDRVKLKASHPDGVPFHENYKGQNVYYRLPDNSLATILEVRENWYKIEFEGSEGWITNRYVDHVIDEGSCGTNTGLSPWKNRQDAIDLVEHSNLLPKDNNVIRVGTWNIRWYPDGGMSRSSSSERRTDNKWLAYSIVWMNVDLLALQEIRRHEVCRDSLKSLLSMLEELTGDKWDTSFQECGSASDQQVGFLWNTEEVNLSSFQDLSSLNAKSDGSDPCEGRQRPGRYAYVKSTKNNGVDFHITSVHLKSGIKLSDYNYRQESFDQFVIFGKHFCLGNGILGFFVFTGAKYQYKT